MALDLRTLDAAYWQPKVGELGAVVTGLDDINQCILTILLTPKGSDPLRPDFALNIFDYVDKPVNTVRAPLVRDVIAAITKWEQRVAVEAVTLEPQADLAGFILSVTWSLTGGVNQEPPVTTSVLVPTSGQLVVSPFVAIPFLSGATPGPTYSGVDGGTV